MEKFKKGEFEKLKDSSIDTWYILINSKFTKEEIIVILEAYQIELPSQNILSNLIKENNILFRKKVEDAPIYYLTNDLRVTYTSFRNKGLHREENFYKIIFKKKRVKKTVNRLKEEKEYICSYNGCKRKFKPFSSDKALVQHIQDVHISSAKKILLDIKFLKNRIVSLNTTLSITVDKTRHNIVLEDINNLKRLNLDGLSNSEKSFYSQLEEYFIQLKKEDDSNTLKEVLNIKCLYCSEYFYSKNSLLYHIKDEHKEHLENFLNQNKINKSYCKYCDNFFIKKYFKEHYNTCSETNCEHCGDKFKKDEYEQHLQKCSKYKEFVWEKNSSIQEIKEELTTLTNIEKHQAIKYQFREDEELEPDLIIDEEAYQKTFGTQLDDKSQQIRNRVTFEHEKIYKQEEEDKSEIKIFLSKMYKGYCQVCGYTFKKTDGVNSFERFNWNDKRVVKVKKSLVSTADSLCLCRNCSANIKWGAFYPNFVDTIRKVDDFKNKNYNEIKEKLHKVVDENIPKIFELLLDIYALEIELDGKARNIYFTNEHLLQFITYLQKEDELEEEVEVKKKRKREKDAINSIYSANSWLKREETIPLNLAESFIRTTANWNHPTAHRYVSAPKHADNIYENSQHGWAVDFGSNSFLVGKAIERCKNSINEYIENQEDRNFTELKESLSKHISGAVATGNNYAYSGYYPIEDGYMKFGVQGIDVEDGVNFLIRRLGLKKYLLPK